MANVGEREEFWSDRPDGAQVPPLTCSRAAGRKGLGENEVRKGIGVGTWGGRELFGYSRKEEGG